jgi:hypothetical protein
MCIYEYTHMHIHIYIYIYICMYKYIYVYGCICTYIFRMDTSDLRGMRDSAVKEWLLERVADAQGVAAREGC